MYDDDGTSTDGTEGTKWRSRKVVPRRKRKIKQTRNIKSRNTAGSNCNDYKPTCLASQSLRVIHPNKLSNVLSERCCERYECENVQTTTQFPFVSTTTGPVDECVKYFDKHGCGEKVQCVGSTVLTQIPMNKTHPSIRRRCCDIWQCNQVDECEQYFEKHSCGSKPTCHGEEILVSKPINKKSSNILNRCCPVWSCEKPDIDQDECIDYFKDHECGKKPFCKEGEIMVGKPIDKSSPNIENRCCPTMACENAKTECETYLEDHNCSTKPICSDTGVL